MGSIVQAWIGSTDGLCTHFLDGPLDRFEEWAQQTAREWPHDFDVRLLNLIRQVRTAGETALQARDPEAARIVDDLIQTYYGDFASLRGRLCRLADPAMLPERYYWAAADALVAIRASGPMLESWRFILDGRPPARDATLLPFAPTKESFRLGFWTLAECTALRPTLERLVRTTPAGEAKEAFAAIARATIRAQSEPAGLIFATG